MKFKFASIMSLFIFFQVLADPITKTKDTDGDGIDDTIYTQSPSGGWIGDSIPLHKQAKRVGGTAALHENQGETKQINIPVATISAPKMSDAPMTAVDLCAEKVEKVYDQLKSFAKDTETILAIVKKDWDKKLASDMAMGSKWKPFPQRGLHMAIRDEINEILNSKKYNIRERDVINRGMSSGDNVRLTANYVLDKGQQVPTRNQPRQLASFLCSGGKLSGQVYGPPYLGASRDRWTPKQITFSVGPELATLYNKLALLNRKLEWNWLGSSKSASGGQYSDYLRNKLGSVFGTISSFEKDPVLAGVMQRQGFNAKLGYN